MVTNSNLKIVQTALLVSFGAFLGWIVFEGIKELFPKLDGLHPLLKIIIGVGGIFILTKIGWKK